MSKFRYYIIDTFEGLVRGTDDSAIAAEWAWKTPDTYVTDSETGKWLCPDGEELGEVEIERIKEVAE